MTERLGESESVGSLLSKINRLPTKDSIVVEDKHLQFSANLWEFVAVYPDPELDKYNRRFWIAQLAEDVHVDQDLDSLVKVFYFDCDNPEDYTIFLPENGRRNVQEVKYRSLLNPARGAFDEESRLFTILPAERDRLSGLGKALDQIPVIVPKRRKKAT
mgnify:CR=1 FL=1